jgi:type 1 fimbria pilin
MRSPRSLVLVSCFLVSVLGASAVKAGGGGTVDSATIRFSGAVVEPTCSVATQSVLDLSANVTQGHQSLQQSCGGGSTIAGATTSATPTYKVDVVHLSGAESDQVLRYFTGYVRAAQASADPELVTQTYD